MRFLILLFLAAPALADGLCWPAITTDTEGRTLPNAVTYQIYQNGAPYGQRIATAPLCAKAVSVPNCAQNSYYVTAWHGGAESKPSNTVGTAECFPAPPALGKAPEGSQLMACRIENAKLKLANYACGQK